MAILCSCGTSHNSQQQKNVPYALSYEDHIRFQEVYSQGVIDRIANDTLGAFKMFEQAAKLNPKSAAANYQLGCVMKAIAFERIDTLMSLRADSLIFLATQQAPDNYEYLETWTDRELNEGHLEEALPLLERLTRMKKNNDERLAMLASVAMRTNHLDITRSALDHLEPLVDDPRIIASGRFLSYIIEEDTTNARKVLSAYATSNASDAKELTWVGTQYYDVGLSDDAKKVWSMAETIDPDLPELQMARFISTNSENDKALFRDIVRRMILNPRMMEEMRSRYVRICSLYLLYEADTPEAEQDKEWAMSVIEEAYNSPVCDAAIANAYAKALEEQGADTKAIAAAWKKYLEFSPQDNAVRLRLIMTYRDAQDWDSLYEQCRNGQDASPDELIFYFLEGASLYQQYHSAAAAEVLKRGLEASGDDDQPDLRSDACAMLGDILHELNRDEEAFSYYEQALSHNADNALCLNNYAYFLALAGRNLEHAEELAKRAVDIEPKNTTYLDTYAWVLFVAGKQQQAKIYIDQAIKYMDLRDADATIFDHAGDIHAALGERSKARDYWTSALKYSDDAEAKKIRKKMNGK